ncbi:MAG TPA: hypothetical protein VFP65_28925 [Anaeromyxobacteraceae bacterium]|nr:hypothetical protein [Anaeromyxobacteraceae bacterium]
MKLALELAVGVVLPGILAMILCTGSCATCASDHGGALRSSPSTASGRQEQAPRITASVP